MSAGFVTVLSFLFYSRDANSFFPGMVANLIVMLGAHYGLGEVGGWGHNPVSAAISDPEDRHSWWQRIVTFFRRLRLTPYLERLLPRQEALYPILGFYILSVTYASLYLLHPAVKQAYPEAYDVIQYSILGLSSTLLMYLIWPPALRETRLLAWAWPGVIFYALFLVGGCLVLMNGFAKNHLFLSMLNLVMAMLLFPWLMVLGMIVVAVAANGLFFVYYMGGMMMDLDDPGTAYFTVVYGLLMASSLLMALFKHRQSYEELKAYNKALSEAHASTQAALLDSFKEKIGLLRTLSRAGIESLPKLAKKARELHAKGQAPLAKHPDLLRITEELEERLVPMAMSLDRIESRVMDYLRLQVYRIPLRPLIEEMKRVLENQNLHRDVHFHIKTEHSIITCDAQRVVTLLVNTITMLRTEVGPELPIHVAVRGTHLKYDLKSVHKDYSKQIAAVSFIITTHTTLPEPAPVYAGQMHSGPLPVAKTPQALLPITNQRIVRAHYGYAEQQGDPYQYVIPVDVRALRTPDMDRAYMDIDTELIRADDHFKSKEVDAQTQEQAFLQAVQDRTKADLKKIRTALEMIKWYHGSMKRKTGEPFYLHPVAVAQIVLDYNQDEATVLGALLHDTVEDTPMLIENIETAFGTEVMGIVAGVTHLESYGGTFQKVKLS
ncbi:MAG: HD domain-containing protein, partial [Bacteroidota bacterium]